MAIATVNPATDEVVEQFDPHDAEAVVYRISQAAHAAHLLREKTTFDQRAVWMRDSATALESDSEHAARTLTLEMGKPITQARDEVQKCVHAMRFYADHAESFLTGETLADPTSVGATRAWTVWEPLGVILAVMPWNLPLWQVIRFAAPALMAGNTGLLKHASNVPRSALYLDTLFERGGFPTGSFRTLLIGAADVAAVITDPRVKAVTATGSEPAGRSVASIAANPTHSAPAHSPRPNHSAVEHESPNPPPSV
ncbi:MAG: aldehyde dehydrogenase family protein [Mycobacterium sp.]|nr:aldehyde dehydrogenase family protein [Mycobacterium sp.]